MLGPVQLGCCRLQLTSLFSMIELQPSFLCEGWDGHPLCLSGDSSVLMDLHQELQELTHEMDRYRWIILGLCEMRWKNFGETTTEEGHNVFFGGKEDKHEHGVGFLVHKDIVNTVMGCRAVSSRLIAVRLRAVPFNITIVQHKPQHQTTMTTK